MVKKEAEKCKVPTTAKYKYLGTIVDEYILPGKAIQKAAARISSIYEMFERVLRVADYRFKINLFWTFIVPIILNIPIMT